VLTSATVTDDGTFMAPFQVPSNATNYSPDNPADVIAVDATEAGCTDLSQVCRGPFAFAKFTVTQLPTQTQPQPTQPTQPPTTPRTERTGVYAGYATVGTPSDPYKDVKGSWVVPTANCKLADRLQNSEAAFWIGMGALGAGKSLEQIGTSSNCTNGNPTYFAWSEMVPEDPMIIDHPIKPGDHIQAEVRYEDDGKFVLEMHNLTQHWNFRRDAQGSDDPVDRADAEWILEAAQRFLLSTDRLRHCPLL
jgi:hypothetical protein